MLHQSSWEHGMCMLPRHTINKFKSQLQAIMNIDRIKKKEKSVDNMYSLVANLWIFQKVF